MHVIWIIILGVCLIVVAFGRIAGVNLLFFIVAGFTAFVIVFLWMALFPPDLLRNLSNTWLTIISVGFGILFYTFDRFRPNSAAVTPNRVLGGLYILISLLSIVAIWIKEFGITISTQEYFKPAPFNDLTTTMIDVAAGIVIILGLQKLFPLPNPAPSGRKERAILR